MNQIAHPSVQQAFEKLKALSADEETQRLAFVRERALRDEHSELRAAEARGEARGATAGIMQGKAALLERLLIRRFGPLAEATRNRLTPATPSTKHH